MTLTTEDTQQLKMHKNKNGAFEMELETTIDADADSNDPFQKIMQKAGNHGRFQIIYSIIFIMGLSMAGAMIYMNIILALNIPDHWCTVPGQDRTNLTLDEWRYTTLPMQKDNRGADKYSSCMMYNENFTTIDWSTWNTTMQKPNVTECQNGWSYDQTWYDSTIATDEHWVCTKDLFVTNVFVVQRVTEVVGSFILGQMGDICGRRMVYYISVVLCSLGRIASIMITSHYTWFLIFSGLAGLTVNSLFLSPQIIGMEISREQDRSTIAILQSFGWSVGTSVMPLLFWWLRDWRPFMWLTTVPTAFFLIFSKYVIESPRWLISKRRFDTAIMQFKKIAKINGREFDMSEKELAQLFIETRKETTYGMASLFSTLRVARNTFIMGYSRCVNAVSYFTLVLYSARMGGNPFLNFLLLSIVEIPAYMVGKYLADKYGRRFTTSLSYVLSFITCIPAIILATDEKYAVVMVGLAAFIIFLNAVLFFTANLQSMEIYPTCMRQTGIALGCILSNATGVVAPILVYLGTTYDIRYPYYILGTMFLIGGIAAAFLPETLHKKLPDTIEEANYFGRKDKFWSFPKPPPKEDATEHLNQKRFAP